MQPARALLFFVGLTLLAHGAAAEEKAPDKDWLPATLEIAAPTDLSDLRSPIVAHETLVASGTVIAIGSSTLELKVAAHGRTVAWQQVRHGDDGTSATRSGSLRLPGLLPLAEVHGTRYPLWIRAAPSNAGVLVGSAYGAALPLNKATGYVVDSDRDGVLGSAGDGLVAPESLTVGPWRGEAWSKKGGRRFRRKDDGAWEQKPIPLPHPVLADHAAAWCLLQWRRQQCGLLTVGDDLALEKAMRDHAEYAASSGVETHEEEPGHPRYTKAGDAAGRSSVIGWEETSILGGLSVQLATMYHRTRVLQPGLTHTALVLHKGVFMLNVFARRGGPLKDAILVYPPHGMANVLTRFHPPGESPMPTEDRAGLLGTAVNVFCETLILAEPPAKAPTLDLVKGRKRKPVEGAFHYPGHPPGTAAGSANRGNVSFVPSLPLRPRSDYACTTEVAMPNGATFTYAWTFSTGRSAKRR